MAPHEELLQKYLDGQCTREETEALMQWLQTTGSHRTLLASMQEEFERSMDAQAEIPAAISDRIENRLLQEISASGKVADMRPRNRRYWFAAAAVALLLAAGIYRYNTNQQAPMPLARAEQTTEDIAPGSDKAVLTLANGTTVTLDSTGNQVIRQGGTTVLQQKGQLQYESEPNEGTVGYNTLTVPRGGQFHVVLPDGSKVWLNSASSLKYPTAFTGNERLVELQGQGYFEVSRNAQQPFLVKVGQIEVQVLGTSFDVMAYRDESSVNTTLLEGAVKVKQGSTGQVLKPGQQARYDRQTCKVTVHPADVQQVVAWKTGFFEFDNAKLSDIMRQVARWYDIDITYMNEQTSAVYGGRISRSLPLSEILHMLEPNGAKFTLDGRKLKVSSTE